MKGQQLYLKVHPYLWEYYRSYYGSEIIDVRVHPLLLNRIKSVLQTTPKCYKGRVWADFRIIVLNMPRQLFIGKKSLDIKYRRFIDDRHQFLISQELYIEFKNSFINFMIGFLKNGGLQSDGINSFCEHYDLEMNRIKYDSLKKIWDRSEAKKDCIMNKGMLINVKYRQKNYEYLSTNLIQ